MIRTIEVRNVKIIHNKDKKNEYISYLHRVAELETFLFIENPVDDDNNPTNIPEIILNLSDSRVYVRFAEIEDAVDLYNDLKSFFSNPADDISSFDLNYYKQI